MIDIDDTVKMTGVAEGATTVLKKTFFDEPTPVPP